MNYVWFILHALELVPSLSSGRTWHDLVGRLFAFTQLPDGLKDRWLSLAELVAAKYERTPVESRRRWAQAGTSLGSAAVIETIATSLADRLQVVGVEDRLGLEATLNLLDEQNVYEQLLALPEAARYWRFRRTSRGQKVDVPPEAVVRDWVAGSDLTELANEHLPMVPEPSFRLEQMVDGIGEAVQHFLSWTVGLAVSQANEIDRKSVV